MMYGNTVGRASAKSGHRVQAIPVGQASARRTRDWLNGHIGTAGMFPRGIDQRHPTMNRLFVGLKSDLHYLNNFSILE